MNRKNTVGAVINFIGIVQGVGFRPYVYRKALEYDVRGTVRNTVRGVVIEVDGYRKNIEKFYMEICQHPPTLAEIHESNLLYRAPFGYNDFTILASQNDETGFTPISPDIATCDECLGEIFNSTDRRYRYPFTNCTNCGPRFTIIQRIPYDRKNTTMSVFPMCTLCNEEYQNPLDRRYHAQPNACPNCGPQLSLIDREGNQIDGDPIRGAIKLLMDGRIIAIKGLGGFHLAVNPHDGKAVQRLRERKHRPAKPFALMARNIDVIGKYCRFSEKERELLESKERPIVLLERKEGRRVLPPTIAPDTRFLGVMLPYTPLHHILLREGPEILVMTSANYSEEPLVYDDHVAFQEILPIADAILTHNRIIARPCDDSVMMMIDELPVHLRRSRGFVPKAISLGEHTPQILSMGAYEKNTFCVIKDGKAFVSHHIGDLVNEKSVDAYQKGIDDFCAMFRVKPEVVVCDLHPDYYSTIYGTQIAKSLNLPIIYVQHHYAHIASVLAEKREDCKVIGIAFDGTGYGIDHTVWGGEFLISDARDFKRLGHFGWVPMPGGEKSILEIDRMALAYLFQAYNGFSHLPSFPFIESFTSQQLDMYEKIILHRINSPLTSSCGRLFDAVSALLQLCSRPKYDAQGAILLETLAKDIDESVLHYPYLIDENNTIRFEPMVRAIVEDIRKAMKKDYIARRFHATVIHSTVSMCKKIRNEEKINTVVISGGAFQNRILRKHVVRSLEVKGFTVLENTLVPPNDGGISLGQGYVACQRIGETS